MFPKQAPMYVDFTNSGEGFSLEEYYDTRKWTRQISSRVSKKFYNMNRRGRKKGNKRLAKMHAAGIGIQLMLGQYDYSKREHRFRPNGGANAYFKRRVFLSSKKPAFI